MVTAKSARDYICRPTLQILLKCHICMSFTILDIFMKEVFQLNNGLSKVKS